MAPPDYIEHIAANQLHKALVSLWDLLLGNIPDFNALEKAALELGENKFQAQVKIGADILLAKEPLRARNKLTQMNPLALFQALDHFLYIRYARGRSGAGQPARIECAGHGYFLRRRIVSALQPRHASQIGHPHSWLNYHTIVPETIHGMAIRFRELSAALFSNSGRDRGFLKLFVAAFSDRVVPQKSPNAGPGWVVAALDDLETRWRTTLSALETAKRDGADVVILPELTICPTLRARVVQWLIEKPSPPFSLVLPGSFHQAFPAGPHDATPRSVYNRAVLFSGNGHEVLSHCKYIPYGEKSDFEGIATGKTIELLETPVGLIAVAVCRDFNEEAMPYNRIWETIAPDLILVPAMGEAASFRAHQRKAESLTRFCGTTCAVANQHPKGTSTADYGFVCTQSDYENKRRSSDSFASTCATIPLNVKKV
ncbi:MAG: hypothetical protein HY911_04065 [Desulfobacterales bacterium]|nr:hypothetical protein [Desulfobacterales bacterium]